MTTTFPITDLVADLVTEAPQAVRLQHLVDAVRRHFGCGAVGLLKAEGDGLRPVAIAGLAHETLGRHFLLPQHPRLAEILASRAVVRFPPGSPLPDPYDGLLDQHPGEPLPVHDCMGIHLSLNGDLWGALTLDALRGNVFDKAAQDELTQTALMVELTLRISWLEEENRRLRSGRPLQNAASPASAIEGEIEIVGQSPHLRALMQELDVVAESELPVLLLGETGVGKELFAPSSAPGVETRRRTAGAGQLRCAPPNRWPKANCSGTSKARSPARSANAPGGSRRRKGGHFFLTRSANCRCPCRPSCCARCRTVRFQRLGADQPHKADVRIVAATNRQLHDRVREGHFRADLYHRLSVYPVQVPPLRERGNDVLLLAGHFLEINRTRFGVRGLRLSPRAETALCSYAWPGNVRELEHVISRAALRAISRGADRSGIVTLEPELLDLDLSGPESQSTKGALPDDATPAASPLPLKTAVDAFQRQLIRHALHNYNGNWARAARQLDVDASNLHKLSRRLGLKA